MLEQCVEHALLSVLYVCTHLDFVDLQPVQEVQRDPVVAMGSAKVKGPEEVVGSATARLAMGVRPVANVVLVTLKRNATAAIWYVWVGRRQVWCWAGPEGHLLPSLILSPSHTACFGPCARCSGPEESHCLQCKKGWALHHLKCVGE